MADREKLEEVERRRYRQHLDEESDQEKEKKRYFYKDVSNFQVPPFNMVLISMNVYYKSGKNI